MTGFLSRAESVTLVYTGFLNRRLTVSQKGKQTMLSSWKIYWMVFSTRKSRTVMLQRVSGIFVLKTIRSLEHSFPWWNFRSRDHSFPGGTFVLGTIHSLELSFSRLFVPWNIRSLDRSFPGTVVPWTVRSSWTIRYRYWILRGNFIPLTTTVAMHRSLCTVLCLLWKIEWIKCQRYE